jgi:hypothetical protein
VSTAVGTRIDLAEMFWRRISSTPLLLSLGTRTGSDLCQDVAPAGSEVKALDCERHARKRGLRHAIDDAVMPMPGSIVDQIDTSVV